MGSTYSTSGAEEKHEAKAYFHRQNVLACRPRRCENCVPSNLAVFIGVGAPKNRNNSGMTALPF